MKTPHQAGGRPERRSDIENDVGSQLDILRQRTSQAPPKPPHLLPEARDALAAVREREGRKLRRQSMISSVYGLGLRVMTEFIEHAVRNHPDAEDWFNEELARFAALDPALLRAVGGDQVPPLPTRVVAEAAAEERPDDNHNAVRKGHRRDRRG